ncbi:MAG: FkbM family methyltransferase [Planctomycetaceae bacterium]
MPEFIYPDFLKLDVQGYELEVLKGGCQALRSAECALLETSVLSFNSGAPKIAEVVGFMSQEGFAIIDVAEMVYRRDRALLQMDLVFGRLGSPWIPSGRLTHENWG